MSAEMTAKNAFPILQLYFMDSRLNNGAVLQLHWLEVMVTNTLAGVTHAVCKHHHHHLPLPPPPPHHQQHPHQYHNRHKYLFSSLSV